MGFHYTFDFGRSLLSIPWELEHLLRMDIILFKIKNTLNNKIIFYFGSTNILSGVLAKGQGSQLKQVPRQIIVTQSHYEDLIHVCILTFFKPSLVPNQPAIHQKRNYNFCFVCIYIVE